MKTCTECGGLMSQDGGLGLCPKCLLATALVGGDVELDATRTADYELIEEIARGGMGAVYRARQRSLNRIVALKVLLGGAFAGEEGRRRIKTEAATAARLQHPNIVPVFDTGTLDGQPFYSMAFVAGRTLEEIVRTGALAPHRAAKLVQTIAGAVQYAHEQGVLHRDLKPGNVIVDEADAPHVTDFGLAKIQDDLASHTLTGSVLGSPAYMSPEQALGLTNAIGPASDVYSLGAILYELLTARPPFQGNSAASVIEQVKIAEPIPLRRLNDAIPADLENICLKCLEKEAPRRYGSAGALAADLARFLKGEPVHARPISSTGRALRWARRHPLAATLAVVSSMLLLAVVIVLAASSVRIRESRDEARARLADAMFAEAQSGRLAGQPGWREKSLKNLAEVARLNSPRSRFELRNEAIAALARPDLVRHFITNLPPTPDEMLVCLSREFDQVALWNFTNQAVEIRRVADGSKITSCATTEPDEIREFSVGGKFLLLRHGGKMSVWSATDGRCVFTNENSESFRRFNGAAFSPDGRKLGRGERGGHFKLYDLTTDPPIRDREWKLPDGFAVGTVAWAADGRSVALVLNNKTLLVCDAITGATRWRRDFEQQIWNVTWDNARDWLTLQSGDERVLVLNAQGREVRQLHTMTDGTSTARFSGDGQRLAVACSGIGTRWFDAGLGQQRLNDEATAWHLQFDSSGRKLGTFLDEGQLHWVEWSAATVLSELATPGAPPLSQRLVFSPDGRWLVSMNSEAVLLWDVNSERVVADLPMPKAVLGGFDATGTNVVVGQGDAIFQSRWWLTPTSDSAHQ